MSFDRSRTLEGIIFDKDGTLFDFRKTWGSWTSSFIRDLANGDDALARELASVLEYDMREGTFAKSSPLIAGTVEAIMHAVRRVMPHLAQDEFLAMMVESTSAVPQEPAAPLVPLMGHLQGAGYVLGVATNDAEKPAKVHLQLAGIMDYFSFVAGYDSGYGAKPGPGMLRAFCDTTSIAPDRCAMVGDSRHDLSSGRDAGMVTIAVLTGVAEADELEDLADAVLSDIGALPAWLGA